MKQSNNISPEDKFDNNSFCNFYASEVVVYIQIVFLDLFYNLKPEKFEYYVCEFHIIDIQSLDESDDNRIKSLCFSNINHKDSTYEIKLKTTIHNPCCFYQYYNIEILFNNSKGEKIIGTYMIPLYYNKKNVIYSLFYNYGKMSFEIIIRKNIFESYYSWIREPELDFINENKCQRITSSEKFEDNSSQKRFLFVNINTYHCFPNLNLGQYSIFNYELPNEKFRHFAIYLDEYFNHIGFFVFGINSLNEKMINFSLLNKLYDECKSFKDNIFQIKTSYEKGNYQFKSHFYRKILATLENMPPFENYVENYHLFLRQNIIDLKEKGNELIFFFSYVNLMLPFKNNNQLNIYFDPIIIMFETFQKYIKDKINDKYDEIQLIFSVSEILKDYLKDDYIENINNLSPEELVKSNLIRIIDFSANNIYSYVENNNYQIISNLNNDSYLFHILNQLNSSVGKNMIRANYTSKGNSTCSMISMITLEDLKKEFNIIRQKYGIKIGFKTDYKAITNILTKITCYNEINIFGNFFETENIDDPNFVQRMKLSLNMKHERFCHTLVSINIFTGNLKGSPEEYLDFEEKTKIKLVTNKKQESGNAFEYMITKNFEFLNFLHSPPNDINFKEFFKVDNWIGNTLDKLYILYLSYIKKNKSDDLPKKREKNDESEEDYGYNSLKICRDNYCDIFKEKNFLMKKNYLKINK